MNSWTLFCSKHWKHAKKKWAMNSKTKSVQSMKTLRKSTQAPEIPWYCRIKKLTVMPQLEILRVKSKVINRIPTMIQTKKCQKRIGTSLLNKLKI